ncbi:hypothetical protein DL93DRAFT_435542 [Clavulina sp. PMI_390]|nr:hypothetical protein DL93DRAFT_435542 [Clavulina sp. PMI_390]
MMIFRVIEEGCFRLLVALPPKVPVYGTSVAPQNSRMAQQYGRRRTAVGKSCADACSWALTATHVKPLPSVVSVNTVRPERMIYRDLLLETFRTSSLMGLLGRPVCRDEGRGQRLRLLFWPCRGTDVCVPDVCGWVRSSSISVAVNDCQVFDPTQHAMKWWSPSPREKIGLHLCI